MIRKTYMGIPGAQGVPSAVSVVGEGSRKLEGDFAWGKGQPKGGDLAKAILADYLGSEDKATRYYRRFMWRTVMTWDAGRAWTLSADDIDAHLEQIRESDAVAIRAKATVSMEQPPVANEGGIGPGGVAFSEVKRKS